jgi:hypothetical protein
MKVFKIPEPTNEKKHVGWITRRSNALITIRNIHRFFRSEWYRMLTEIDGEYLIQNLFNESGTDEVKKLVNQTIYDIERID